MYGNGIGTLTISISDTREGEDRDIWSLTGEAGNSWYQAEVPVSSANPFKIVITAKIGKNNLGDIAVDDISLTPGSCPSTHFCINCYNFFNRVISDKFNYYIVTKKCLTFNI
jgi:hypothetical protein